MPLWFSRFFIKFLLYFLLSNVLWNQQKLNILVLVNCEGFPFLSNGTVSVTSNGSVTMATIECYVGHTLKGSVQIECGKDGMWTTDISAITCGKKMQL